MPGPLPKPADQRARRNKDPHTVRILNVAPAKQPSLPARWRVTDGKRVRVAWPAQTLTWWKHWAASPLSDGFTAVDWDFLADTALIHAAVWGDGDLRLSGELRQRVGSMGATEADRARLRIVFAAADEAEGKSVKKAHKSAATRYQGLQAVSPPGA